MRILTLALILCPLPAVADPLQTLEPLLEVFSATHDSPGYDVVGVRCAGLIYAQDTWRKDHGGAGPTKHLLSEATTGLEVATQHRVGLGQDLTTATLSIEADFRRVYDLYLARLTKNAESGHPWSDDPLLKGDRSYCNAALG